MTGTNPKYVTSLKQIPRLGDKERADLAMVAKRYPFRSNDYYLGLIDWNNPQDPIRRIAVPCRGELTRWGALDASRESDYTVAPGLEHKYADTALLLVNKVCGGVCRFCFRKRLFLKDNHETLANVDSEIDYIRENRQISNVLMTGGDPLLLSTRRLASIVERLCEIDHVRILRIGSKMPAFNPFRILNDPALAETIRRATRADRKVYVMCHFNHPRELTEPAIEAVETLQRAGAIVCNQTPMIRGVNDDPAVLAKLFRRLSFVGATPYYVFQCRPTAGNRPFAVPIEEAYLIFTQAQNRVSGLAKRARYAMSHATGKIEIVGLTAGHVFMKYHRAADPENCGRFMVFERNPEAYWFDDYDEPMDHMGAWADEASEEMLEEL